MLMDGQNRAGAANQWRQRRNLVEILRPVPSQIPRAQIDLRNPEDPKDGCRRERGFREEVTERQANLKRRSEGEA